MYVFAPPSLPLHPSFPSFFSSSLMSSRPRPHPSASSLPPSLLPVLANHASFHFDDAGQQVRCSLPQAYPGPGSPRPPSAAPSSSLPSSSSSSSANGKQRPPLPPPQPPSSSSTPPPPRPNSSFSIAGSRPSPISTTHPAPLPPRSPRPPPSPQQFIVHVPYALTFPDPVEFRIFKVRRERGNEGGRGGKAGV